MRKHFITCAYNIYMKTLQDNYLGYVELNVL